MMFLFLGVFERKKLLRGLTCVVNLVTVRDGAAMLVTASVAVCFIFNLRSISHEVENVHLKKKSGV